MSDRHLSHAEDPSDQQAVVPVPHSPVITEQDRHLDTALLNVGQKVRYVISVKIEDPGELFSPGAGLFAGGEVLLDVVDRQDVGHAICHSLKCAHSSRCLSNSAKATGQSSEMIDSTCSAASRI